MNAPLFRQVSRGEFNAMTLEERLEYMSALMADLRRQIDETKRQVAQTKQTLDKLEKKV